ncbi:MAG: thioredoxin family protein [Spirochaetales bacterium]|nr:thioredoxin family protein [Spirochaetales bacterium]
MRRIIYMTILILIAAGVQAQQIDWLTSWDKAFSQAEARNKNVFVLITAPSWCGPCQILEKNVWPDPKVAALISADFVPLRLEDVVDGKRNPELSNVAFQAFPTMYVYNRKKEKLAEFVGALEAEYLTVRLAAYTDPNFDITSTFGTLSLDNGWLRQKSISEWEYREGDVTIRMPEVARNDTHAFLYNSGERYHLAVPLNGPDLQVFWSRDNGKTWQPWKMARKVSQ